jgi:hypothetical protein
MSLRTFALLLGVVVLCTACVTINCPSTAPGAEEGRAYPVQVTPPGPVVEESSEPSCTPTMDVCDTATLGNGDTSDAVLIRAVSTIDTPANNNPFLTFEGPVQPTYSSNHNLTTATTGWQGPVGYIRVKVIDDNNTFTGDYWLPVFKRQ